MKKQSGQPLGIIAAAEPETQGERFVADYSLIIDHLVLNIIQQVFEKKQQQYNRNSIAGWRECKRKIVKKWRTYKNFSFPQRKRTLNDMILRFFAFLDKRILRTFMIEIKILNVKVWRAGLPNIVHLRINFIQHSPSLCWRVRRVRILSLYFDNRWFL